jgi:phosphohistidine phosphatase
MKIIFFRHAKTELNAKTGKDFDRGLRDNGIRQCTVMNDFIKKEFSGVDFFVLCSTAKRTRQTYKRAFDGIQSKVKYLDDLYLASAAEILKIIQYENVPNDVQLVILGHNDGLTDLVNYLTDANCYVQTSGWVEITFDVDDLQLLSRGLGTIARYYRPVLGA